MASVASLMPIDIEDEEIILKILKLAQPSYSFEEKEMEVYCLTQEGNSPLWYANVYRHLKDQTIMEHFDKIEKIILKRSALKYVIIGDILYRRSFYGDLLRCLPHNEVEITLQQVDDGLCGGNLFAKVLYTKLLRIEYYWPIMEEDHKDHA